MISTILQWTGALSALVAAGLWFWSAATKIPDTLEMKISGNESPSGYMKRQSKRSAYAAVAAGASAACHAIVLILEISK